jgi:cell wall-associated NlpC family hydrolase
VEPFSTSNPVDPGSRISLDVGDLINQIDAAVESIPASADQLKAAMAPNFSDTTAYPIGAYVWNNGTLYRFTAAHAAGSWTGTDATAIAIGNDVADIKSALGIATGYEPLNEWTIGKYYRTPSSVTNISIDSLENDNTTACRYTACSPGDRFTITGHGASGGKLWVWTQSNGDIISRADSNAVADGLVIVAPSNAAYLLNTVLIAYDYSLLALPTNKQQITKKYSTVADMISDTSIIVDDYVETLGYGAIHDGMGALYHVVNDGYSHTGYEVLSNGLYAVPMLGLSVSNLKPPTNIDKMIEVAESFQGCGHSFTYGHVTAVDSAYVPGTYVIDCSALAWLVMNGVTFENSKYSGATANTRTIGAPEMYNPPFTGTMKIRSAYQMALYFAYNGLAYVPNSDRSNLRIGDFVFFSNNEYPSEPDRYMEIDHVAIYLGRCESNNSGKEIFQVIGNNGDTNNPDISTFFYYYTKSELNKIVLAAACPWENLSRISDGNIVVDSDTPIVSESEALLNEYNLNTPLKSYTAYTIDLETDAKLPMLYFTLPDTTYKLYMNAVSVSTIYPLSRKLHVHFITGNISGATVKNKIRVYTSAHSGTPYTINRFAMERGWL